MFPIHILIHISEAASNKAPTDCTVMVGVVTDCMVADWTITVTS